MAATTARVLSRNYTFSLVAFGVLGIYFTWGRTFLNGTFSCLLEALFGESYVLPNTEGTLMRTSFTGIYWPVDWLCDVMVVFFWEVVDGSHPTTSAIGLYFIGQHLSITTALYIDGYRNGSRGKILLSATFWLLIFQLTAIGTSGPMFLAYYLLNSPTCSPISSSLSSYRFDLLGSPMDIYLIPISVSMGYLLPTVFMSIKSPTYLSPDTQQAWIAVWGFFPIFVYGAQQTMTFILRLTVRSIATSPPALPKTPPSHSPSTSSSLPSKPFLTALRTTYMASLLLTIFSHHATIFLSLATLIFPMLFSPSYATALHPTKLLIPPFSLDPPPDIGTAIAGFMQWDQIFGYAAVLWLGAESYFSALRALGQKAGGKEMAVFGGWMALLVLALGPGGAFLYVLWARDELVLEQDKNGEWRREKREGRRSGRQRHA